MFAFLLTPPGGAAIAVIRLCGSGVGAFLHRHFSKAVAVGRAVHGELRDGENVLDDPVVILSNGGEAADLCVHGGPWIVRSILELARRAGFDVGDEPAAPDQPLPRQSVDACSEIEAEVLQYLPLARTEAGLRLLLAQPVAWERLDRELNEAGEQKRERIEGILADRSLHWMLHPPRVAIMGSPNVGKSTLANQLFAQERSITADMPGTTRDWVGEYADIDGLPVMLLDTPGLRTTDDAIEGAAMARAAEEIRAADLVIAVAEAGRWAEQTRPLDEGHWRACIRVANKIDAARDAELPADVVRTAATRGEGIAELRRAIASHFGCDRLDPDRPRCWTERQRERVKDDG